MRFNLLIILLSLCGSTIQAQQAWNMQMLYNWTDTTLTRTAGYNSIFNEVWGMTHNGREYGVIGSTEATHIFDITNPATASLVATIPGTTNPGYQYVVHKDYHDYNGYLYMVSDEDKIGLQIYDLSYLPDSVKQVYASTALFERAHNIFIDSSSGRLYVCSAGSATGGFTAMKVYSLANPTNPSFLFDVTGMGHVHDAYVRNDTAYLNCGTNDGLWIVDCKGASPQLITTFTNYVHKGYNHSGWLSEDGRIYAFADETKGKALKICDVSNLSNIVVLDTISSLVDTLSVAHNLMIKNGFLYVSYYHDGMQIFDIRNPSNPVKAAYFDTYTPTDHLSYRGNWGVYCFLPSGNILASDMQYGFFVLGLDPAVLGTSKVEAALPNSLQFNISPNPCKDFIQVQFNLEKQTHLRFDLYTIDGRYVQTLLPNTLMGAGSQQLQFTLPSQTSSGLYRLQAYSHSLGAWGTTLSIQK